MLPFLLRLCPAHKHVGILLVHLIDRPSRASHATFERTSVERSADSRAVLVDGAFTFLAVGDAGESFCAHHILVVVEMAEPKHLARDLQSITVGDFDDTEHLTTAATFLTGLMLFHVAPFFAKCAAVVSSCFTLGG